MKYTITKADIIKAVLTEPIRPGQFYELDWNLASVGERLSAKRDNGTCNVCAVGAVLRQLGRFTDDHAEIATGGVFSEFDVELAHKNDNFLSILSCEFEDFSENHSDSSDETLFHLLSVIEAFCPKTLTVEI